MKVGIITFHASHNYGSMLQAYALSTFMSQRGCTVEIINLRTPAQYKLYPHPLDLRVRKIRGVVADMTFAPISVIGKWYKYERFLNKNLPISKIYHSIEELRDERWDIDALVVGSDQIWNTFCDDFSEAFFGDFVGDKIIKIAYAPSMGSYPEKQVDKELVKKLYHGFAFLSVREPRTAELLKSIGVDQDIDIVLDPTLLLNEHDYDGLYSNKRLIDGNYIYFYDPFRRAKFLKAASYIGERLGMKVVVDRRYSPWETKGIKNLKYFVNVGPSEFLNLVKNASLVCGHSFHSIVFSILFKKDFLALDGDKDSRLANILSQLGLEKRMVNMDNYSDFPMTSIEDYDTILGKLDTLRETSVKFLVKSGLIDG